MKPGDKINNCTIITVDNKTKKGVLTYEFEESLNFFFGCINHPQFWCKFWCK